MGMPRPPRRDADLEPYRAAEALALCRCCVLCLDLGHLHLSRGNPEPRAEFIIRLKFARGHSMINKFAAVLMMAVLTASTASGQTEGGAPGQPSVTVLDTQEVQGILGREVRSLADENMGRIVDVLVDGKGMARAAIIDFGGFLGVGS